MALKIELKGTAPGRAELNISGAGSDSGPIEISIQRNQDEHYLAAGGSWQGTPFWHVISSVEAQPGSVVAGVGPEIVDPLVQCSGMSFFVSIRSAGINGQQMMKTSGRLLGSGAAGNSTPIAATPKPKPAPAPVEQVLPPEPPPAPEPAEVPSSATGGRSKALIWILLALLLLGLAAAAVWYFGLLGEKAEPVTVETPVVEPTHPPKEPEPAAQTEANKSPPAPVEAPALSGRARAQAYLRDNPAATEMLATAVEWEKGGDCEAALILLNTAAAVDAPASMALAQRYDPASVSEQGCIKAADAETAVYWYERPAEQGDRVAQSRLGLLLTEQNSSGPLYERGLGYLRKAAQAGDGLAAERLQKLGE